MKKSISRYSLAISDDGDWKDYNIGLYFIEEEPPEAGVLVFD